MILKPSLWSSQTCELLWTHPLKQKPRKKLLRNGTALRWLFKSTKLHCFMFLHSCPLTPNAASSCSFVEMKAEEHSELLFFRGVGGGRLHSKSWDKKVAHVPQSLTSTDFIGYCIFINMISSLIKILNIHFGRVIKVKLFGKLCKR